MTEQTDRELLEMAKEAGLTEPDLGDWITDYGDSEASIKRFAALVEAKAAAKERESCAQVCDAEAERALFNWRNDLPSNQKFWNGAEQLASVCAAAIRARSTT